MISHACIRYKDQKYKNRIVEIKTVFYERNDTLCIDPANEDDYDPYHYYYVWWEDQEGSKAGKECSGFFPSVIVSLGSKQIKPRNLNELMF